jgi:hypothetical protein
MILKLQGEDRRKWDVEFGIRHYAGTVVYKVVLSQPNMALGKKKEKNAI